CPFNRRSRYSRGLPCRFSLKSNLDIYTKFQTWLLHPPRFQQPVPMQRPADHDKIKASSDWF
ncbi:MAG: hypothetical protein K8S97_16440, partial [Anaerolineae bacterium]|nr:hypothetical protein [Anaerolineae bacterium]